MVDYTGKCGTCQHYEARPGFKSGWCHANPYDDSVLCDPKHPYAAVAASKRKCPLYLGNVKP